MKKNQPQVTTTQRVQITKQELRIAPLPEPEELQRYELVQPGFAERLLIMAEKEQDRRLKKEDAIIDLSRRSLNLTRLGLWLGFLSVVVMTGLCSYFAFLGDVKAAAWTAGAVIIGLAAVFVTGRVVLNKNDSNKNDLKTN
jgi:uncharacterized membrane protein